MQSKHREKSIDALSLKFGQIMISYINCGAVNIDIVAVAEKDSTHTGFKGYRGGEVEGSQGRTVRGEARFTGLTMYGLGAWRLKFRYGLPFQIIDTVFCIIRSPRDLLF